jgi:hypothetical protein
VISGAEAEKQFFLANYFVTFKDCKYFRERSIFYLFSNMIYTWFTAFHIHIKSVGLFRLLSSLFAKWICHICLHQLNPPLISDYLCLPSAMFLISSLFVEHKKIWDIPNVFNITEPSSIVTASLLQELHMIQLS